MAGSVRRNKYHHAGGVRFFIEPRGNDPFGKGAKYDNASNKLCEKNGRLVHEFTFGVYTPI